MLRFCRYGLPVSLLSLACSPFSLAEETSGAHELGQITVSATRAHSTVDETPQKVLIISREEIEEQLAIVLISGLTPLLFFITGTYMWWQKRQLRLQAQRRKLARQQAH